MAKNCVFLMAALFLLVGCNRNSAPKTLGGPVAQTSMPQEAGQAKALEAELQKYSGAEAKN
jgi:hypothetical protein